MSLPFGPGAINMLETDDPFGGLIPQGLPRPKVLKPAEVRRQAQERKERLLASYHELEDIVKRHEAMIQRRWTKKTRRQRLQILQADWNGMPASHRPDFALMRKRAHQTVPPDKERSAYIWTYFNQEDMGKAKSFLLLINARGRNHPSRFAAADGEAMHIGLVSRAITPVFLNKYVMLLNGITDDEEYGKLLSWDDHEDAFDWMHTRKQFLPGEGLLILEAQERLLANLVSCCRQILHDISPQDLVDDALYPVVPEPEAKDSEGADGMDSMANSLSVMAEEAPYRLPERLDLDRIERLLAARKASAEDHAWALREDPGCFADEVLTLKEHRQEMIRDANGDVHPTLRGPRQGILWGRVLGNVLVEAYLNLDIYTKLHKQAQELQKLHRRYAAELAPLDDLPEPFLAGLLKFRHYLRQAAKGPMAQLKANFVSSPPMRRYYVRKVPESATSTRIITVSKPGVKLEDSVSQLVWLLTMLWEDGRDLFLCGMFNVLDELDRLLAADARARECISSYTARMIGDLAVLGECMRQIDTYQPWANGFENALVNREKGIMHEFAEAMAPSARILEMLSEKNIVALRTLGDPSDGKFAYPVGKRRNAANVAALRAAEANLDAFWAKADGIVRAKAGSLEGSAMQDLLSQPRLLQRTPEWFEPPKAADKQKSAKAAEADELSAPLSSVFLGPDEGTTAGRKVLATPRTKAKTRGTAAMLPVEASPEPDVVNRQPVFQVDARALRVFRIVFFDPDANTTPGEVAWNDFLHALRETGFTAQKMYGSVWQFQPTKLDVERGIQFHEPHPHGKIPFVVARRNGRRLGRAYGWHGGMFVLREK